jgi:hypothetical protein
MNQVSSQVSPLVATQVQAQIPTEGFVFDFLNDSRLKAAYSVYDLFGTGTDIVQTRQGYSQVWRNYTELNTASNYSTGTINIAGMANQVTQSTTNNLTNTQGSSTTYLPHYGTKVSDGSLSVTNSVKFNQSGQYSGENLEVQNPFSKIGMDNGSDFTIVTYSKDDDDTGENQSSINYRPTCGGFHLTQSMGVGTNDDFIGTTQNQINDKYHASSMTTTSELSADAISTTNANNTTFQTVAGTFKIDAGSSSTQKITSKREIYIDGVLEDSNSQAITHQMTTSPNGLYLTFGGRRGGYGGNGHYWIGQHKAMLVFNGVLTAEEILSIHQQLPNLLT